MRDLTQFIARLKALHVFLLLAGPMIVSQLYLASIIAIPRNVGEAPDFVVLEKTFKYTMMLTLLLVILLMSWIVSIGVETNARVLDENRPKKSLFLLAAIYAVSYIALAQFIFPSPTSIANGQQLPGILFPMHMLAMVALFYTLGFAAKNLIMVERQTEVTFLDYAGPLFLMWFFPLGVWFVQPRVNRLIESSNNGI